MYIDGEEYASDPLKRAEVIDKLRAGDIKVICNRYVMREGIDIPELYHIILATPIGSLSSYVQVVGRALRNHPSLDKVIVQDHAGNFWRHGSANANRAAAVSRNAFGSSSKGVISLKTTPFLGKSGMSRI